MKMALLAPVSLTLLFTFRQGLQSEET